MSQSNSMEWFKKAEIDYFAAFIKLWLSFNALYRRLFQNDNLGKRDRNYIEALKKRNNSLKTRFRRLFEENFDEAFEFKLLLKDLISKFDGGIFGGETITSNEFIRPQMNDIALDEINFKEFIHPRNFLLVRRPPGYVKIGKYYIRDNPDEIWPYFIEVLYMIRNQLIHGELEPTEENHKIIEVCYKILNLLIKDEV